MTNEQYLDAMTVDGLDETFANNMDVDYIESPVVLLMGFLIDRSSSMQKFEQTMQDCLPHYKNAICESKQADEMLVSKTLFGSDIEVGGYVAPKDFNVDYSAYGCTKLYDVIIDHRQRLLKYMDQLRTNGTNVRAAIAILSDGEDVGSTHSLSDARKAVEDMISKEITVAFIAFGQGAFGIAKSLGITPRNTIAVDNNESELRRVIDLVSKSAISASKKASSGAGTSGDFFDV